jgi:LPXTG-motif cell wall-anchored protein
MSIVRVLGSIAAGGVLVLAPTAAFAAPGEDYGTVVAPTTTVSPPKQHHPAVLPNTGVDAWTMALGAAGAALVLGGGGVVVVSRRRKSGHA